MCRPGTRDGCFPLWLPGHASLGRHEPLVNECDSLGSGFSFLVPRFLRRMTEKQYAGSGEWDRDGGVPGEVGQEAVGDGELGGAD